MMRKTRKKEKRSRIGTNGERGCNGGGRGRSRRRRRWKKEEQE